MSQVHLELPEVWRRLAVTPDGDRDAQRALLDSWCAEHSPDAAPVPAPAAPSGRDTAVTRLVRESRRASREGIGFAAVLLALLPAPPQPDPPDAEADSPEPTAQHLLLAASLTVSFRHLPGETDPGIAAQGTLEALRQQPTGPGYATRRLELVGLARDRARPAVLLREQRTAADDPTTQLALSQVLWLVPGSSELASVAVATPNRELATSFTELALCVASSLRVVT